MSWVSRVLQTLGLQHKEGRLPLINPAVPRKQLWMFVGFYALFAIILAVLHHTLLHWL